MNGQLLCRPSESSIHTTQGLLVENLVRGHLVPLSRVSLRLVELRDVD